MAFSINFPASSFAEAAVHMPGPVFAAMDGAQFDDLPALLKEAGLAHRSLFLGHADEEAEKVGPWFVDLAPPGAAEKLVALLGAKPAAVLWSCPLGEAALYRHLRGLNMAVVPLLRDDAPKREEGVARPAEDYRDENVLFRHFDPRVLMQVLPVLDEGQYVRVLGPAYLVVLPREGGGKPRFAPALEHSVIVPHGPLRLRPEQLDEISEFRVQESRRKIMAYLRDVAPDETSGMDDRQLYVLVLESERTGKSMGLTTERAFGKWAYLSLGSKGEMQNVAGVKDFIMQPNASPDKQMDLFMDSLIAGAHRMGRH